jgi:hypothetical protein
MKPIITRLTLVGLLALTGRGLTAEEPLVLDVWPGQAPGETGPVGEEFLLGVFNLGAAQE